MVGTGTAAGAVEFTLGKPRYVGLNLAVFAVFGLAMSGFLMLVNGGLVDLLIGYTRPVDLWSLAVSGAGVVFLIGAPGVVLVAVAMPRTWRSTVLTPYGVDAPPQRSRGRRTTVAWWQVAGVGVVRAMFWHQICLRTVDGRSLVIAVPVALRRDDPRLTAALSTFRDFALRYGGRVDGPVPPPVGRFRRALRTGFVVLGLLGWVWLATVPFVPPWAPYASELPDPCAATVAAGVDRYWPAAERESWEARDATLYHGISRECAALPAVEEPAFDRLQVSIERYDSIVLSTGAKRAYEEVAKVPGRHGSGTAAPLAVGDRGYLVRPYQGETELVACRGNVVVTVRLSGGGDDAARVARRLAAGVLGQVRFT